MTEPQINRSKIILSGTDPDLPDPLPQGYDRYSDFKDIARGMKAQLHSCWDSLMGRHVALKTLLPDYAQDVYERRRFLREARVTAQLAHPSTVAVYDIGRDHEGGLYFTMKRLAGENLFKVLQRLSWGDAVTEQKYPLDVQLGFIIKASQSLAYAHKHGVIHRDIKPENIWVGDFGEVVVLDWGVAKVWGGPADTHDPSAASIDEEENRLATPGERDLQSLTMMGQRPGTPLYMSPEQVRERPLDERSDIFSMGVVLYEMLAFREPFRGNTIRETFDRIVHFPIKPPSEHAPDRGIPESLDWVVMKATAKKPDERFDSMLDLIDHLRLARLDLLRGADASSLLSIREQDTETGSRGE